MKVGDLVKTKRAGLGVPLDSVGLVLSVTIGQSEEGMSGYSEKFVYYDVQLCNSTNRTVRRLKQDLEVISESR